MADSGSSERSSPRHALITGGAGFIGSHLAAMLLERGWRVTVVDNLSTGRRGNLPGSHPRLAVLVGGVTESLDEAAKLGPFDHLYHLAAAVGVKLIVTEPIRTIETNIFETASALRFALRAGAGGRPCRTLVASSSEVYGKSDRVPFREDDDVTLGPTTKSRWSYACTKAIDEYLALAHHREHGLPVVVTRFFNTVGPGQVGEYGMVLPSFVAAALRGDPLTVYGSGSQVRCFCDVRDVVRALPALLDRETAHGRVFNLGSDEPISIWQLAERVVETLGSGSRIDRVAYEDAYEAGFEDLRLRQPDLSRIRAEIGFDRSIPLEQTIRDVAEAIAQRQEPVA